LNFDTIKIDISYKSDELVGIYWINGWSVNWKY